QVQRKAVSEKVLLSARALENQAGGLAVGPDQAAGAELGASEIPGDDEQEVGDIGAFEDVIDRFARSAARLAAVGVLEESVSSGADTAGPAVMGGAELPFPDRLQSGHGGV